LNLEGFFVNLLYNLLILKYIIFLHFSSTITLNIFCQSTVPATGGNAEGNGGSVSYSAGQTFYSWISGTSGSVIEGVQLPYEISTIDGAEGDIDINLNCSIFPNPAVKVQRPGTRKNELSVCCTQCFGTAGDKSGNRDYDQHSPGFSKRTCCLY
jgi:hypothetical protein